MNNIAILEDTLDIISRGWYMKDDKKIDLKLSPREMKEVKVFLPSDVRALEKYEPESQCFRLGRCGYDCENIDSFTKARNNYVNHRCLFSKDDKEILVLNFANPVNPGGRRSLGREGAGGRLMQNKLPSLLAGKPRSVKVL